MNPEILFLVTLAASSVEREHVAGEVWHHTALLRVGAAPEAVVRLHRVVREQRPFVPRPTRGAAVLLHGDFSRCATNFLPADGPALALHLAERDLDVWCIDRRWTLLPQDTSDFSSLAGQGIGVAVSDLRRALAVIRLLRGLGGGDFGRVPLVGYSRGGVIAYAAAAAEGRLPAAARHVGAVVPLDVYYRTDDEAMRAAACARHADQQAQLAAGTVVADNTFFQAIGGLALADPDGLSPIFADGSTNAEVVRFVAGLTFVVFTVTPWYHLAAAGAEAFLYSDDTRVATWFADATPWQALQEVDDGDALWCGETPPGVAGDLSAVRVPVLYVGAAGGFGALGRHTTTLVGGPVDEVFIRLLPEGEELLDFGHADLLFSELAAPAWDEIAAFLSR